MTDVFRATIDELAGEVNRQIARVRETYARLGEVESTATSADGLVSVTVGSNGQVRGIELNPRVYRKLDPSELAGSIMAQVDRATAVVSEERKKLMEPLMPDGVPYEEVFGERITLDAFLPQPVKPEPAE